MDSSGRHNPYGDREAVSSRAYVFVAVVQAGHICEEPKQHFGVDGSVQFMLKQTLKTQCILRRPC